MAGEVSFDVVSDFDEQELRNALDQVRREVQQRYDFKGATVQLTQEKSQIVLLTDDEFRANLDGTLPWLGERLARPVRDLLVEVDAVGVTIVACGPAAAVPLHAAPWFEGGSRRCLLDEFSVRVAPSATLAAAARRRGAGGAC